MSPQIPTVEAAQLPNPLPDELLIVDVREPDEWDAGHIAGSLHVPMMEVMARLDDVRLGREVLVVCRVGARSAQVTAFYRQQGIEAANLAGGLIAWEYAGRALVADGHPPFVG